MQGMLNNPNRNDAIPEGLITPDAQPLIDRPRINVSRLLPPWLAWLVRGVICSLIAMAIWNQVPVWNAIRYVAAGIVHTTGDPLTGEGGIVTQAEEEYKKLKGRAPHIPVGIPNPLHKKSPEQIEDDRRRKEAEDRRREESEIRSLQARADVIGFSYNISWPVEKYRVEVPAAEGRACAEKDREKEAMERKALINRGTKANLGVNPELPLEELRKQVEEAERELKANVDYQLELRRFEEAKWQYDEEARRGPNARCPVPKCRFPLRLHTTNPTWQAMCPSCNYVTSRRVFLAQWRKPPPPQEPTPPRMNKGILGRFFK